MSSLRVANTLISPGKSNSPTSNELPTNPLATTPFVVVVRVTTQCALACQFCGFSRELQRPVREIASEKLELLGATLSHWQRVTQRPVLVSWLGGEPFQWSHWQPSSQRFVDQFQLDLSVTTNGLALQQAAVRGNALQLFRQITVSIDGLAGTHDRLRQTPGMFARLEKIMKTLVAERDSRRVFLRVNTVLTRDNILRFGDLATTLAEWGVDELTFNPLGGNDRPEFFPDNRLRVEQILKLRDELPELRARVAPRGLRISGSSAYLDRLEATARGQSISVADCLPGQHFLFVDELGRVSPCSFTAGMFQPELVSTNALDLELWSQSFSSQIKSCRPTACHDCHANHRYAKFEPRVQQVAADRPE